MYKSSPTLKIFCILATLSFTLVQTDQLEDKLTQFSQDLFQNVEKENHDKNVVIAPVSIQSIIAMLYMGARGKTATEIGKTFANENKYAVADYYDYVLQIYYYSGITVASKLYINKNFQVKEKYRNYLGQRFRSSIEAVDFSNPEGAANYINAWVKIETKNLIPQLVQPATFSVDSNLFLVNSITFTGDLKFNKADTQSKLFNLDVNTTVKVPMMRQIGNFITEYHKNLRATSLILPYEESGYSFVIFLPNSHEAFYELENKIKDIKVSNLKKGSDFEEEIEVRLPRFKVEFEYDLKKNLINMGLTMFAECADFGDIAESEETPLYLSKFIHKAVIVVDEKDSTTAPASCSEFINKLGRKLFNANRPFIYFITNELDYPIISGSYKGVSN